jgi:N-acetyl-gamma-glutamyl-phosphate reductase
MRKRANAVTYHDTVPVAILGGTGYVAGELVRILLLHPHFKLETVVSTSQAGERVTAAFPHLLGTAADALTFESLEALTKRFIPHQPFGVFAATPHGATAALLDQVLGAAEATGTPLSVVDLSADFRFPDPETFAAIYGQAHAAPQRIPSFECAVPEHFVGRPSGHAVQPGCFTTSVVIAAYPFFALNLVADDVFAAAITGSSGSGRKLGQGTHHPERRSNLYAYSVLGHRHEPEMRRLLGRARGGRDPDVQFVPHSGPFVRGIHATLRMTLHEAIPAADLVARVNAFYAGSPFVFATEQPARLTEVVGTNRCRLGIATRGRTVVVTSVIDNLVKGAAGGAVQWMNRLMNVADDTGLRLPGLGWY